MYIPNHIPTDCFYPDEYGDKYDPMLAPVSYRRSNYRMLTETLGGVNGAFMDFDNTALIIAAAIHELHSGRVTYFNVLCAE